MSDESVDRHPRRTILIILAFLLLGFRPVAGQLSPDWTVTVNGQKVQVNPDGTFVIPNVSAADSFGSGGPGTPPDFLSDDFLRLTGVSTIGGVTRYVFSEPFKITQGQSFVVGGLTFTDTPPPVPQSIQILVADPTLTAIGQSTQIETVATLADGSIIDVTPHSSWTTYRTSNPGIATIDQDGFVTASGAGIAFLTATNGGATAVAQLVVAPGDPLTIVEGIVALPSGLPVESAAVTLVGLPGSALSLDDGSFSISGVATTAGSLTVVARATVGGEFLRGRVSGLEPVPAGITDAGIISLDRRATESVLIVGSDTALPVNQLLATESFVTVESFDARVGTPTLAQLSAYDAVLAYTNFVPQNAVAFGDVLADYVDDGGQVTIATYSFSTPWEIRGRITEPGYSPLCNGGINGNVSGLLVATEPSDPIFEGVTLANVTYFNNFNFSHPTLDVDATLLATDGNGINMIARNSSGNVVAMNLFPGFVPSGNNAEFYRLLANTLLR